MTIIDINTRFAYCYKIKSKSADEIHSNLEIFVHSNKVLGLSFDNDKEFNNSKVINLLKSKDISYIFFDKEKS